MDKKLQTKVIIYDVTQDYYYQIELPESDQMIKDVYVQNSFVIILGDKYELWKYGEVPILYDQKKQRFMMKDLLSTIPLKINELKGIKVNQVACNSFAIAATTIEGNVYSWGNDDKSTGILGLGNIFVRSVPTLIQNLNGIKTISLSNKHASAIDSHTLTLIHQNSKYMFLNIDYGNIYQWGTGFHGELGIPNSTYALKPYRIDCKIILNAKVCISYGTATALISGGGCLYIFGKLSSSALTTGDDNLLNNHELLFDKLKDKNQIKKVNDKPFHCEGLRNMFLIDLSMGDKYCVVLSRSGDLGIVYEDWQQEKIEIIGGAGASFKSVSAKGSKIFALTTDNKYLYEFEVINKNQNVNNHQLYHIKSFYDDPLNILKQDNNDEIILKGLCVNNHQKKYSTILKKKVELTSEFQNNPRFRPGNHIMITMAYDHPLEEYLTIEQKLGIGKTQSFLVNNILKNNKSKLINSKKSLGSLGKAIFINEKGNIISNVTKIPVYDSIKENTDIYNIFGGLPNDEKVNINFTKKKEDLRRQILNELWENKDKSNEQKGLEQFLTKYDEHTSRQKSNPHSNKLAKNLAPLFDVHETFKINEDLFKSGGQSDFLLSPLLSTRSPTSVNQTTSSNGFKTFKQIPRPKNDEITMEKTYCGLNNKSPESNNENNLDDNDLGVFQDIICKRTSLERTTTQQGRNPRSTNTSATTGSTHEFRSPRMNLTQGANKLPNDQVLSLIDQNSIETKKNCNSKKIFFGTKVKANDSVDKKQQLENENAPILLRNLVGSSMEKDPKIVILDRSNETLTSSKDLNIIETFKLGELDQKTVLKSTNQPQNRSPVNKRNDLLQELHTNIELNLKSLKDKLNSQKPETKDVLNEPRNSNQEINIETVVKSKIPMRKIEQNQQEKKPKFIELENDEPLNDGKSDRILKQDVNIVRSNDITCDLASPTIIKSHKFESSDIPEKDFTPKNLPKNNIIGFMNSLTPSCGQLTQSPQRIIVPKQESTLTLVFTDVHENNLFSKNKNLLDKLTISNTHIMIKAMNKPYTKRIHEAFSLMKTIIEFKKYHVKTLSQNRSLQVFDEYFIKERSRLLNHVFNKLKQLIIEKNQTNLIKQGYNIGSKCIGFERLNKLYYNNIKRWKTCVFQNMFAYVDIKKLKYQSCRFFYRIFYRLQSSQKEIIKEIFNIIKEYSLYKKCIMLKLQGTKHLCEQCISIRKKMLEYTIKKLLNNSKSINRAIKGILMIQRIYKRLIRMNKYEGFMNIISYMIDKKRTYKQLCNNIIFLIRRIVDKRLLHTLQRIRLYIIYKRKTYENMLLNDNLNFVNKCFRIYRKKLFAVGFKSIIEMNNLYKKEAKYRYKSLYNTNNNGNNKNEMPNLLYIYHYKACNILYHCFCKKLKTYYQCIQNHNIINHMKYEYNHLNTTMNNLVIKQLIQIITYHIQKKQKIFIENLKKYNKYQHNINLAIKLLENSIKSIIIKHMQYPLNQIKLIYQNRCISGIYKFVYFLGTFLHNKNKQILKHTFIQLNKTNCRYNTTLSSIVKKPLNDAAYYSKTSKKNSIHHVNNKSQGNNQYHHKNIFGDDYNNDDTNNNNHDGNEQQMNQYEVFNSPNFKYVNEHNNNDNNNNKLDMDSPLKKFNIDDSHHPDKQESIRHSFGEISKILDQDNKTKPTLMESFFGCDDAPQLINQKSKSVSIIQKELQRRDSFASDLKRSSIPNILSDMPIDPNSNPSKPLQENIESGNTNYNKNYELPAQFSPIEYQDCKNISPNEHPFIDTTSSNKNVEALKQESNILNEGKTYNDEEANQIDNDIPYNNAELDEDNNNNMDNVSPSPKIKKSLSDVLEEESDFKKNASTIEAKADQFIGLSDCEEEGINCEEEEEEEVEEEFHCSNKNNTKLKRITRTRSDDNKKSTKNTRMKRYSKDIAIQDEILQGQKIEFSKTLETSTGKDTVRHQGEILNDLSENLSLAKKGSKHYNVHIEEYAEPIELDSKFFTTANMDELSKTQSLQNLGGFKTISNSRQGSIINNIAKTSVINPENHYSSNIIKSSATKNKDVSTIKKKNDGKSISITPLEIHELNFAKTDSRSVSNSKSDNLKNSLNQKGSRPNSNTSSPAQKILNERKGLSKDPKDKKDQASLSNTNQPKSNKTPSKSTSKDQKQGRFITKTTTNTNLANPLASTKLTPTESVKNILENRLLENQKFKAVYNMYKDKQPEKAQLVKELAKNNAHQQSIEFSSEKNKSNLGIGSARSPLNESKSSQFGRNMQNTTSKSPRNISKYSSFSSNNTTQILKSANKDKKSPIQAKKSSTQINSKNLFSTVLSPQNKILLAQKKQQLEFYSKKKVKI